MLDRRVIDDELNEIVDDIGEEDGEEESSANERLFSGDGIVFGYGNEGEYIYFFEDTQGKVGLLFSDEGVLGNVMIMRWFYEFLLVDRRFLHDILLV